MVQPLLHFFLIEIFVYATVFPNTLALYLKDLKALVFTIIAFKLPVNYHKLPVNYLSTTIYCCSINLCDLELGAQFLNPTGVELLCTLVMISPLTKM